MPPLLQVSLPFPKQEQGTTHSECEYSQTNFHVDVLVLDDVMRTAHADAIEDFADRTVAKRMFLIHAKPS